MQEFEKKVKDMAEVQKFLLQEIMSLRDAVKPNPSPTLKLTYTVAEASQATGLKRGTIRGYIKKGILDCVNTDKNFLISAASLHAFVQQPFTNYAKKI